MYVADIPNVSLVHLLCTGKRCLFVLCPVYVSVHHMFTRLEFKDVFLVNATLGLGAIRKRQMKKHRLPVHWAGVLVLYGDEMAKNELSMPRLVVRYPTRSSILTSLYS